MKSSKDLILIDCETTNLVQSIGNKIENQPHIIELYCMRTTETGKFLDEFYSLFSVPVPIPDFITKITGWTDKDLKGKPKFKDEFENINNIFKGAKKMVAHNLPFDKKMIEIELTRINRINDFSFPPDLFCTIEQSLHLKGFRLTLKELHEMATGLPEIVNAHKADADVKAMLKCYLWLIERGN